MNKVVFHGEATIRALVDSGAITGVTIREGVSCDFHLVFSTPGAEVRLAKKRSQGGQVQERTFKDLTRAANLAKSMGLIRFVCEMSPLANGKQSPLSFGTA